MQKIWFLIWKKTLPLWNISLTTDASFIFEDFYSASEGRICTLRRICLSSSALVLPLDVTTTRACYDSNSKEVASSNCRHSKWRFTWSWVRTNDQWAIKLSLRNPQTHCLSFVSRVHRAVRIILPLCTLVLRIIGWKLIQMRWLGSFEAEKNTRWSSSEHL